MIVKDCMTPNPITVSPEVRADETLEMMKKLNFRQCPVVEDGNLVGIVTDRDIRTHIGNNKDSKVRDIMSTGPITVFDYASVEGAAEIIRSGKFNALPVVSSKNELVGILSVTDLLDAFLNLLSFHEKPLRLEVHMSEDISLFDVLQLIQNHSEKVLSFSVAPEDRKLYYFWVVNCNFGEVEKELRARDTKVSTIHT